MPCCPRTGARCRIARDIAYGAASAASARYLCAPRRRARGRWCVHLWRLLDGRQPDDYEFAGRALAAPGLCYGHRRLSADPRGGISGFLEDCAEAFGWVARQIGKYGGDPERMALMGHSAGAYNAVMLALDPAYLRARGLLDRVKAVVGLSGPYNFLPYDGPISLRIFGAVRNPKSTQPVNLVTEAAPPMFLANGERDTLVGRRMPGRWRCDCGCQRGGDRKLLSQDGAWPCGHGAVASPARDGAGAGRGRHFPQGATGALGSSAR